MKKMFSFLKNIIKAEGVLAISFIAFIVYMFLSSIGGIASSARSAMQTAFRNDSTLGPEAWIEILNDSFDNMLSTEQGQFFLHNKGTYIDLNGLMARCMGQRKMNDLVKLDNGYLCSATENRFGPRLIGFAEKLNAACSARGSKLLVGLIPTKVHGNEDLLPRGCCDTTKLDYESILDQLEALEISTMDFADLLQESGRSMEDAFFKTDHHWRPEMGWWAYTQLVETLEAQGWIPGVDDTYTDADSFAFETMEGLFLGYEGKRTGKYFAGVDDFTLIYPKFEVDLRYVAEPDNRRDTPLVHSGDYLSAAFSHEMIQRKDFYNLNPYDGYGWGNEGCAHWRNASAPVDQKVLLIGDSYANVMFSFLPLVFTSCDEVDFRYYLGDFRTYFEEFNPDIVIIAGSVMTESALVYKGF